MSLYESGESTGEASLMAMFDGTLKDVSTKKTTLDDLAKYIVRGGWPENLTTDDKYVHILPKSYLIEN